MDYSLLIGVVRRKFVVLERDRSQQDQQSSNKLPGDIFQRDPDGGMHAAVVEGPGTYYMGIIDVLQQWNWEKKLERFFKIYFKWEDGDGLSAIPPSIYGDRFMRRCVVEAFDGLHMADSDFNPKGKLSKTRRSDSNPFGDDSSVAVSIEQYPTGTDRRFSAAPLDPRQPPPPPAAAVGVSPPWLNDPSTRDGGTTTSLSIASGGWARRKDDVDDDIGTNNI
jgi:1-phosphatidylinositol-4-phosphate 5-kinase